jgi:O-antigen/teichoic acid export membrane protein
LAVTALIVGDTNLTFLAIGYVVAGCIGVIMYGRILWTALRRLDLLRYMRPRSITIPARELLSFGLPLLTTDLVFILMLSADAIILAHYKGTEAVAAFRAVLPVARLNQFVLTSFGLLFMPLAARLFARRDHAGVDRLYWQSAMWVAVATFPILALTLGLARPVTLFLFGERYASSASVLAVLSLGYFVHAAFGFNGMVLGIYKKVRFTVLTNVVAVVVNVIANLILVPRYGALGAAFASAGTLIGHNIVKQAGLRYTAIALFPRDAVRVYVIIVIGAASLVASVAILDPPLAVGLLFAGAVSACVFLTTKSFLEISETFPELERIPLLGAILRSSPRTR